MSKGQAVKLVVILFGGLGLAALASWHGYTFGAACIAVASFCYFSYNRPR
jgi:hypothetical protein